MKISERYSETILDKANFSMDNLNFWIIEFQISDSVSTASLQESLDLWDLQWG